MSDYEFTVTQETAEQRLDVFLAQQLPEHTRGGLQRDIDDGRVVINGAIAKKARKTVHAGDIVSLNDSGRLDAPVAESQPLEIIYEDASMLAVNKPAGMVVHPNRPEEHGTLVQALLARNPEIAQALYDPEAPISKLRPGIVHRLDKDTSGVIVVAKTTAALQNLTEQFHTHTAHKEYLTLVEGAVLEPATIRTMLKRTSDKDKNRMGVSEEGRLAITNISPEQVYQAPNGRQVTLLRCVIETGRTHQIRVHCRHSGHPVLGDELYYNKSSRDTSTRLGITRQLLHAAELTLRHPDTNEPLRLVAKVPEDFLAVLTALNPV